MEPGCLAGVYLDVQVDLRPKDSGVCAKETGHEEESWRLPRGRTTLSIYPAPLSRLRYNPMMSAAGEREEDGD